MTSLKEFIEEGTWILSYYEDIKSRSDFIEKATFFEWATKALMYLQEHFPEHPQIEEFEKYISYGDISFDAFSHMIAILKAFDVIKPSPRPIMYDEILATIFNQFHVVAKQLKHRHNNRNTIQLNDEYDVQDLLHGLLALHFDDVRPEEWTPSYAGGNNRMDFLIKDGEIAIEVKMTRKGLKDKEVGEQLIIDITKYRSHPNCKFLYCFVYDPDEIIRNPRGIEKDLEANSNGISVKVYIRPTL